MEDPRFLLAKTAAYSEGASVVTSEQKSTFAHGQLQKRAVSLLFTGSVCGLAGFLTSAIIGIHKFCFTNLKENYLGQPFASGNNYRPLTVSEMVHDVSSPEGKAFYAFCLMGAICILVSWYSFELRNVYVGDTVGFLGCLCSWPTVRHYLPPLGMLLVACIPVVPPVNRLFGDTIVILMHTLGAVFMIGGYCVAEIHCLFCSDNDSPDEGVHFKPMEKLVRTIFIALSLLCGLIFEVCGIIAAKSATWTCADVWRVPTLAEVISLAGNPSTIYLATEASEAMRLNHKMLYNTASKGCLTVKALEFWFEVFAGFFMICNMLAIWYFCPERQLDLPDKLPDLSKIELREQGYEEEYVQYGYGPDPGEDYDPEWRTTAPQLRHKMY